MQTDCFPDAIREWPKSSVSVLGEVNPRYPLKNGCAYPFIEMASVAENFGGITRIETRKLEGSGLSRFKVGDTIFAKITPCPENGKVAFVRDLPAEIGIGSTEFIVLSPRGDCIPRFLFHLLCCYEVRGRAVARMEGSTGRQRVPDDVFARRLLVPIPPREEQAAIAWILDAVDAALARSRAAVDEVKVLKCALLQQFFYSALGETAYADRPRKKLPRGWSLAPMEALLAGDPRNGVSPKASMQPPGIPTFSIAAVREGRVDLENKDNLKYVQVSDRVANMFRVNRGDVLIVRGNANPDLVGKAAIVDRFPDGCIYPDITKRVVFHRNGGRTMNPEFAVLAWNHAIVHNQVLRRAKTSNGTLKINNRDVKQIIMPLPPVEEQSKIVELVAALEAKADAYGELLRAQQQLKRSLMYDLFTGAVPVPLRQLESVIQQ